MKVTRILAIACALCAVSYTTAVAQSGFRSVEEHTAPEDNMIGNDGKVNRGSYLTNAWYDNWSFGIAGGIQGMFARGNFAKADFAKAVSQVPITGEIEINITKWLTPSVALRLGYQGAWIRENRINEYPLGNRGHYQLSYDEDKGGYLFNNMYIHGDVMLGLSNLIGGYKETRIVNVWTYLHAGYYRMSDPNYNYFWPENKKLTAQDPDHKKQFMSDREFGFGPGVLVNFRLNNNWSATFDVRDVLLAARYHHPDIDQEKLNTTESFRLQQYLVKTLSEDPKHVFYLTGSADKGTGTLKRNLYLSKVRAYNIKDILIKNYGVPESQVVIKASIVTDTHEDGRLDRCVLLESE